jgi:beta-glucosidase
MSDWFGTYGVDEAINAGLDLEMPGPPRWRTPLLVLHTMSAQKLLSSTLDARAANVLRFIQKQARRNPEVVYGDGEERSRDSQETRDFCRKLAAEGLVLLKNENQVLPLTAAKKRVLITGPNAQGFVISGGGSAQLKATYVASPYASIASAAPAGVEVLYTVGCYGKHGSHSLRLG